MKSISLRRRRGQLQNKGGTSLGSNGDICGGRCARCRRCPRAAGSSFFCSLVRRNLRPTPHSRRLPSRFCLPAAPIDRFAFFASLGGPQFFSVECLESCPSRELNAHRQWPPCHLRSRCSFLPTWGKGCLWLVATLVPYGPAVDQSCEEFFGALCWGINKGACPLVPTGGSTRACSPGS